MIAIKSSWKTNHDRPRVHAVRARRRGAGGVGGGDRGGVHAMSMMRCDGCGAMTDTDYTVEGLFEDAMPWRYWCPHCVENAAKNSHEAILGALKIQEPERYEEMME